jgi:hypothetical protein
MGHYRDAEGVDGEDGTIVQPAYVQEDIRFPISKTGRRLTSYHAFTPMESLAMVERYTRSGRFQDSLKFYKALLS